MPRSAACCRQPATGRLISRLECHLQGLKAGLGGLAIVTGALAGVAPDDLLEAHAVVGQVQYDRVGERRQAMASPHGDVVSSVSEYVCAMCCGYG